MRTATIPYKNTYYNLFIYSNSTLRYKYFELHPLTRNRLSLAVWMSSSVSVITNVPASHSDATYNLQWQLYYNSSLIRHLGL